MENTLDFEDLLRIYYQRLFPFDDFHRWLSYANTEQFSKREFSFTLKNDVYLRFQSFKNRELLENEVKRLNPVKIDIGAIYNVGPKDRRKYPDFKAIKRELVFDLDMTDYDEVRTCCSGADVCFKCWKFLSLACKILDRALREDFGFKHMLWVFSGRRGIHCWVCDPIVRKLSAQQRSAIAEYLHVIEGGVYVKKKVNLPGDLIHPAIQCALDIITPVFVPMCIEEQDILGTEEQVKKFLEVIEDENDRKELSELMKKCTTGADRWNMFVQKTQDYKKLGGKKWNVYKFIVEEVMLQYAYPRLDIQVSKGLNHLLKAPFCVHPQTGKICIPFTVKTVDNFDPDKVPKIRTVIDQINDYDVVENTSGERNIQDYQKTDLIRPFRIFHEFLWSLEEKHKGLKKDNKVLNF